MKLQYNKPGKEMFVRTLPMGSGLIGAMLCPDSSDEESLLIMHGCGDILKPMEWKIRNVHIGFHI